MCKCVSVCVCVRECVSVFMYRGACMSILAAWPGNEEEHKILNSAVTGF